MARSPTKMIPLPFPFGGVSEHFGFNSQDRGGKESWPTCVDARNVRGYDPLTGRLRGAQRAGHSKYVSSQVSGGNFVQHINQVVASAATGSANTSVRTIKNVVVAGGDVKTFTSSGISSTTGGSGALSSTFLFVDSAVLFQVLYFVDGMNYMKYTAATDTTAAWSASAGTLPANGSNKPRLICNWRSRIVLSGIVGDEHNWFMSKVGDALDWDYSPATTTVTQAVAGNNAEAGKCPDVINSLVPYRDDILIFGCDHSIYQMTGDPAAGGQIDLLTSITGMAFGKSWCMDPQGRIYFFGSRGGLYRMAPGLLPERLSAQRIEERLNGVDLSKNAVRLAWDDQFQSVHVYITRLDSAAATTHYVYDVRNNAFWPDTFESTNHDPTTVFVLDGDDPNDRVMLLGCRDGYLRYVDEDAVLDDDQLIDSYVWLGPITGGYIRLRELQFDLGRDSDILAYRIHVGRTAESAYASDEFQRGFIDPQGGRSQTAGGSGQAIYVKLESSQAGKTWQYEGGMARVEYAGLSASRRIS